MGDSLWRVDGYYCARVHNGYCVTSSSKSIVPFVELNESARSGTFTLPPGGVLRNVLHLPYFAPVVIRFTVLLRPEPRPFPISLFSGLSVWTEPFLVVLEHRIHDS